LDSPELGDNPVAALLRLETAKAREAASLVQDLDVLIPSSEGELRRAFSIWLARLFRKFPFGATIPSREINLRSAPMLEETFKEWEQKMLQEGRREGRQEGRRQGRQEGQVELVLEMLRQRFGPVPQAIRQRVREMPSSELRILARRILAASSLQQTGLLG
jgi:hypothetical protein